MASDEAILVCLPVLGTNAEHLLPTSTITKCQHCHADVWIAPSGIELVAEDPTHTLVLCNPCALVEFNRNPPEEILAPPGAWEEIQEHGFDPNDVARARLLQIYAERARRK